MSHDVLPGQSPQATSLLGRRAISRQGLTGSAPSRKAARRDSLASEPSVCVNLVTERVAGE